MPLEEKVMPLEEQVLEVSFPRNTTKPSICVWSDFKYNDADELFALEPGESLRKRLADVLNFTDYNENQKSGIIVDLLYFTLLFARDNDFNKEQMSALFSIMKRLHEKATETPFGNTDEAFSYFKKLLLCHSVKRPPYSIALYSIEQVKKIIDYALNTYFRHFKLYKYAFTPKIRLNLTVDYFGLPEDPEPEEGRVGTENIPEDTEERQINVEEPLLGQADKMEELEEPIAVKELKSMISTALNEQVQKLKLSMDKQLKVNEEESYKKVIGSSDSERAASRRDKSKKK